MLTWGCLMKLHHEAALAAGPQNPPEVMSRSIARDQMLGAGYTVDEVRGVCVCVCREVRL